LLKESKKQTQRMADNFTQTLNAINSKYTQTYVFEYKKDIGTQYFPPSENLNTTNRTNKEKENLLFVKNNQSNSKKTLGVLKANYSRVILSNPTFDLDDELDLVADFNNNQFKPQVKEIQKLKDPLRNRKLLYNENGSDLNDLFDDNLNSENEAESDYYNKNQRSDPNLFRKFSNYNQNESNAASRTIKRVRFSETRLEIDQTD
jgi:hypothetical protein